jgi:hypothetical protein
MESIYNGLSEEGKIWLDVLWANFEHSQVKKINGEIHNPAFSEIYEAMRRYCMSSGSILPDRNEVMHILSRLNLVGKRIKTDDYFVATNQKSLTSLKRLGQVGNRVFLSKLKDKKLRPFTNDVPIEEIARKQKDFFARDQRRAVTRLSSLEESELSVRAYNQMKTFQWVSKNKKEKSFDLLKDFDGVSLSEFREQKGFGDKAISEVRSLFEYVEVTYIDD